VLEANTVDAMLHLRDFSHFGIGGEELLRLPEDYGVPCFYIHGNHEAMGASRPGLPPLDRGEAVALDGRMQIVNGVRLLGFAPLGSSPAPLSNGTPSPASRFTLFLSHEPPSPWFFDGGIAGSSRVSRQIGRCNPDLTMTGHFHEKEPRMETIDLGGPVLNPGLTGVLLHIDIEEGSFRLTPCPHETGPST